MLVASHDNHLSCSDFKATTNTIAQHWYFNICFDNFNRV